MVLEGSTEERGSRGPLPRLYNIQYLRALAALAVVAFHAGLQSGMALNAGAWGVDVFFVISGFLMVAITNEKSRSWPFLRERILRVVPLYWLATCAAFLMFGAGAGGRLFAVGRLIASFLFLPWGSPGDGPWFFPVLNVGWTLNYEMLFYALFAGSLILPRRWQLTALGAAFLALALAWLTNLGEFLPWKFWGHPIIFDFLAGTVLAASWKKKGRLAVIVLLAAIVVAAVAVHEFTRYPVRAFPLVLGCALVTGAVILEGSRRPFQPALLLGDASYSIYLWHYLGIVAVAPHRPAGAAPAVLLTLYFASGVSLGLVAHVLLERPLLKAMRSRGWKENAPVPGGV